MSVLMSKKKTLVILGIVLSMILIACGGAQTTTPEPTQEPESVPAEEMKEESMEEFVSMTELYSVNVPANWSSEELVPGGAFVMANSQDALDRFKGESALESGDFVINVGFLPYRLLETNELRALNFRYDASPEIFFQSLLPMFQIDEAVTLSDPELTSLGEGIDAGLMRVSGEGREGMILMFLAGDRVVAMISAVAYPGEMDNFEEITYSVAAEVVFSGSQDALYGALLGS